MSNGITKHVVGPTIQHEELMRLVDSFVVRGDISALSPKERTSLYVQMCNSLGLNPATQPLANLKLNGKDVLYPTRGATDQLARLHNVTRTIIDGPRLIDVAGTKMLFASCEASTPDGRKEIDVATLPATDPVNGYMKLVTKAKRRATLSILGLGMLDETELETIPAHHKAPSQQVNVESEEPSPIATIKAKITPRLELAQALDVWVTNNCTQLGELGQDVFREIMRSLPPMTPKQWIIENEPLYKELLTQPIPEPVPEEWEPNDRWYYQTFCVALGKCTEIAQIAELWLSFKSNSTERYLKLWQKSAIVRTAWTIGLDAKQAQDALTKAIKELMPPPPTDKPKRGRKPTDNTKDESTPQPSEDVASQTVAQWQAHLEAKCAPSTQELERSLAKRLAVWPEEKSTAAIEVFMEYLVKRGSTQAKILAMVKTARDLASKKPMERAA